MHRKQHLLPLPFVLAAALCAYSQDSGTALLQRSLSALPGGSLSVQGSLTVFAAKKITGRYTRVQSDPGHWREEISLPGYSEVRAANAPKLLVSRSTGAEPLFSWALFEAMHPQAYLTIAPGDRIRSVKKRKIDGHAAACLNVTGGETREVCVDEKSADLLMVNTGPGIQIAYTYRPRDSSHVPATIRITQHRRELLLAEMDPPSAAAAAPGLQAPGASSEFGWCPEEMPAVAARKTPPRYPENARQNHIQGTSAVYAVIERDGSLSGLAIVESAGKDLDDATLNAVRQWSYRPATCGGAPVRTEVVITVNYSLSG